LGSVKSPPEKPTMPALLTRRSTSAAVAAAAAICAAFVTSSCSGVTREPARHERIERRDVARGGVHFFHAGRDERVHDSFADATVGAGDECGLP
jgi:hypothetical protein